MTLKITASLMAFTAAALLASCMSIQDRARREVAYQPQQYQDGYVEGCESGNSAAGYIYARFTKQVSRYDADRLYKQGWDDGFAKCKGEHEAVQRSLRR